MSRVYYAKTNFLALKRHSSFHNFKFSFSGDSRQVPKKTYLIKLSTMTKTDFFVQALVLYILLRYKQFEK